MAVTDANATAVEYRERTTKSDAGDDATILAQLKAVTRFLDSKLRRFFTQDASVVTRLFDGNGRERLWLPADIATATGLVVKADLDGDYAFTGSTETLTLNTHFWVGPDDADKGSEAWPFEFLEIVPNNSVISAWPEQRRAVQVTAKFGWPAIPEAIKELTVAVTRTMRDMQEAGGTLTLQDIDAAISLKPDTAQLWRDIQRQYKRPTGF